MTNSMYSGTGGLWSDIWASRQSPENTTPSLGASNSWSMMGPDGNFISSNDIPQIQPEKPQESVNPIGMGLGAMGDILGMAQQNIVDRQQGQQTQEAGGHTHGPDPQQRQPMELDRMQQIQRLGAANPQYGAGLSSLPPPQRTDQRINPLMQGRPSPFAGGLGGGIFGASRQL